MIDRPMREHLEILRLVAAFRLRILEDMGEADALDRRLRDAPNMGGRLDGKRIRQRRSKAASIRATRIGVVIVKRATS